MHAILFLLLGFSGGGEVHFAGTTVYHPLKKGEVAISHDHHVFVLDTDEKQIIHYNEKGEKVGNVSRKGKGPGELRSPKKIYFANKHLYVWDGRGDTRIMQFKTDGSFVAEYNLPRYATSPVPVNGGWVFIQPKRGGIRDITMASLTLTEPKVIHTWKNPNPKKPMMAAPPAGGKPKIPFNPVRDDAYLVASPDGTTVYYSHPTKFKVDIIDVASGKLVNTLEKEVARVPYNEPWANTYLEEYQGRRPKISLYAKYTEFFPSLRGFYVAANGALVGDLWTSSPDKKRAAVAMNKDGKDAKMPYDPKFEYRVLGVVGEKAFLSIYDGEEDEARIIRCNVNKVNDLLASHAIDYFEAYQPRLGMPGG